MSSEKLCRRCRAFKLHNCFRKDMRLHDGLNSWCKQCIRDWKRGRYHERRDEIKIQMRLFRSSLKKEMIDAYGGRCSCCGETAVEFMTLEHLNHDGKEHRKSFRSSQSTWADLRRRGWPKEGYTVMCMNCNWARRHGKECPHTLLAVAYGWCV